MKLKAFKILNYKSLNNVELNNLGDIAVLVGRNDSGKSNVLKAIDFFFNWQTSQDWPQETVSSNSIQQMMVGRDAGALNFAFPARDFRMFHAPERPIELSATVGFRRGEVPLPETMYFDFEGSTKSAVPMDVRELVITASIRVRGDGLVLVETGEIYGNGIDILRRTPEVKKALWENDEGKYTFVNLRHDNNPSQSSDRR